MSKLVTCPFCKRVMDDDIGAYYHRRDCERRDLIQQISRATARGAPYSELLALNDRLEFVSNTGD